MTAPIRPEPGGGRIARNIAAMQSQGASDDDIEAYLTQEGIKAEPSAPVSQPKPVLPGVRPDVTSLAPPRQRSLRQGDLQAVTQNPLKTAGIAGKIAGMHALNTAQGIPGAEAAEAGIYSGLSGKPYPEALKSLRSNIQQDVGPMAGLEKLVGGGVLAKILPIAKTGGSVLNAMKSGFKVGGGLSAADVALQADPNVSMKERAVMAPIAGLVGGAATGLLSGAVQGGSNLRKLNRLRGRAAAAETGGKIQTERGIADEAQNIKNYTEGSAAANERGGTSPILEQALERPLAAEYAGRVRRGQNKSNTDLAQAAYKRMSFDARRYKEGMKVGPYNPDTQDKIDALKEEMAFLRSAMESASERPPIMLDVAPETRVIEPTTRPGFTIPSREERGFIPESNRFVEEQNFPSGPTYQRPRSTQAAATGSAERSYGLRVGHQLPEVQGPRVTRPGAEISTSGMRIQTAPGEHVPAVAPEIPKAIGARQVMGQNSEAFQTAYDHTLRIMSGKTPTGKKLGKESIEAAIQWVNDLRPGKTLTAAQIEDARRGALAAAKTAFEHTTSLPTTGVGMGLGAGLGGLLSGGAGAGPGAILGGAATMAGNKAVRGFSKLANLNPFINALDVRAGTPTSQPLELQELLRKLGIANAPIANP